MVDSQESPKAEGSGDQSSVPPKIDLSKRMGAQPPANAVPTPLNKNATIRLDIPAEQEDTKQATPAAIPVPKKDDKNALNTTIRLDMPPPGTGGNPPAAAPAAPKPAQPAQPATPAVQPATPAAEPVQAKGEKNALNTTIRLDLPPPGETPAPAAGPATVRLKAPSVDGAAKKKETSRIPLESAQQQAKPDGPGTIRIKPSTDPKRKTSRISLEAALAAQEEGGEDAADRPKTIRLKKPDEVPTVKMKPSPAAPKNLSKTAEINVEEEDDSPTRKKTIVVKRPTQRPSVKGVSLARKSAGESAADGTGGEAGPAVGASTPIVVAPVDKPHWIFHTLSIAAILTLCVTIYVLCAQAFGPNYSLTELSYGAPNLDLAWPNKLVSRQY